MKNKILFLSSLFLVMIFVKTQAATITKEITINNETRQLIAPEGESFTWYFNGQALKQNTKSLKVSKSGSYKVEVASKTGEITTRTVTVTVDDTGIHKIYIIGDSTVCEYSSSKYPWQGWGALLQHFFDDSKFEVENHAIGGRSSKSFFVEGRWETVKNSLAEGDYVFMQWGINDRDYSKPARYTPLSPIDSFSMFLNMYVDETREKGAIPVIVSPMVMCTDSRNVYTESGSNYRGAAYNVSQDKEVAFVDLNLLSYANNKAVGQEYLQYFWYMWLEAGEYDNYPDGYSDDWTHFQEMGAMEMAKLITDEIEVLATSDTNMAKLNDARTNMIPVNTKFNKSTESLITRSAYYPVGSTVTIKTRVDDLTTFNYWEDTLGNKIIDDNLFSITVEDDTIYKYVANITTVDCNGDVDGEASVDGCSRCSGGNTGVTPCEVVFQSEDACAYTEGSKISTSSTDGVNREIVNTYFASDSLDYYVTHNIYAPSSGTYTFILIYKSTEVGEQINISVNDEVQHANLDLLQNSQFNELELDLTLAQGDNIITYKSSAVNGGIKFDLLATSSSELSEGDCSVSVNENVIPDVKIYPNPFTGNTAIVCEGKFTYRIYSTSGHLLSQEQATNYCLSGSGLEAGLYLIQVIQNSTVSTYRIVKE